MKPYIVEEQGIYKEFPYIIIGNYRGHRCGYVGVKPIHQLYKEDYTNIDLEVHGGLTFSDFWDREEFSKGYWWLGFDCAHFNDFPDITLIEQFKEEEKLYEEGKIWLETMIQVGQITSSVATTCTSKDTDYVRKECKNMIDQIIKNYTNKNIIDYIKIAINKIKGGAKWLRTFSK